MSMITPGTCSPPPAESVSFRTWLGGRLLFGKGRGSRFRPRLFGYFTTITVRSNNGPGWPDNDELDELPRAPANLCDGELEFVTILDTL